MTALTPSVEFEAQRVAAAFEIPKDEEIVRTKHNIFTIFGCWYGESPCGLEWDFRTSDATLWRLKVGDYSSCVVFRGNNSPWLCLLSTVAVHNELMARGLCKLGVLEEIPELLPFVTAHERLELRLSLPREFWPAQWLEEGQNAV